MDGFTVERHEGRLVEARVTRLMTSTDVAAYSQGFLPFVDTGSRFVLCADHRGVRVYPPEVAESLVTLFTGLNRTWERAALIVAPTNATLVIQLQRLVRESKSPSRRLFLDATLAEAFLREALNREEGARLRSFLADAPS